jgi:REP element-mobilizing transposase RayT
MSTQQTPLIPGQYYHVFNKSVGGEFLFRNNENYRYFMEKYQKYVAPYAETLAWCLMPTHFHFLIKPKDPGNQIYEGFNPLVDLGSKSLAGLAEPAGFDLSRKFSHLFNCYAQAYNKQNNRCGSLFKNRFKRVLITDDNHLRTAIIYIHLNPSHHKIERDFKNWKYSSYNAILQNENHFLNSTKILEIFDDTGNFIFCHNKKYEIDLSFE